MKHYNKLKESMKKEESYEEKEEVTTEYKDSDPTVIAQLFGLMLWSRDQTHYWHLQTDIEAMHLTLGAYYDGLLIEADRLAEALIGRMGRPTNKFLIQE
jgi:hypothetical protein